MYYWLSWDIWSEKEGAYRWVAGHTAEEIHIVRAGKGKASGWSLEGRKVKSEVAVVHSLEKLPLFDSQAAFTPQDWCNLVNQLAQIEMLI